MSDVRVRFAPSPTGHLHIGGARTAIYNWAFARRNQGTFVLRIDDTDPERSTEANTQQIVSSLRWLGLDWDEGPEVGGEHGPYFQTQRASRYADALERLRSSGHAYPCFCSAEQLDEKRTRMRSAGGNAGYDRTCRAVTLDEAAGRVADGEPHVWRLAVPETRGDVVFDDAVRGEVRFPADTVDDFVLVRTDGTPTYNFASAVDDADMGITHVIRGDDHLSNTPKQIVVFESLGHEVPVFGHLSMILGADGKRLSKRHGATSVEAYRDLGYLPEALLNYLALLGWSLDDKTTVISAETLTENFSLDRVSKNPAVFDDEKLEWLNGVYIREMPLARLADIMSERLISDGLLDPNEVGSRRSWLEGLASLVRERIKRLDEIAPTVRFLFADEIEIEDSALEKVLAKPGAKVALLGSLEVLGDVQPFEHDAIEGALRSVPEKLGLKPKIVFQAVRVAITGSAVSPPLFESLALLGRDRTLDRIHKALPLAAEQG